MRTPASVWRAASIRTRLLASVIAGVVVALAGFVLAFNVVLAARLNSEANDLARGRAGAQISALQVVRGHIRLPEASDGRNPDLEVWVFQGRSVLERPQTPPANDRAAVRLAQQPPRFADVPSTGTRLYAAPVGQGRPVGAVVVGVNLGAYDQTRHTALIASAILAAAVLLLVIVAARWLIERALAPVATMTRQASEWSEHDLTRRFTPGEARDEIALLSETLNGLLERLSASLRHEQRVSAEISHELRTPLAQLIAEAQSAQRYGVQDETLDRILDSAQRLRATLDALMAAVRAELSPQRARTDAVACARAAVDDALSLAAAEAVTLTVDTDGPALVSAEPRLVERILAPLVENAIRHAAAAVTIHVRREDDAVRLTVEDDGPGVPARDQETVFLPGSRGPALGSRTAVSASGAGLGLALCRRLATSAGGEVHLEPSDRGARFTVRLPAV